ncbi:MAG TPA: NUDIX domain-containing protein [Gammaproteobacteria bacterium]|nr:NUDIX domain-containing protein [Gammaproteobacteria bacterium]
MASTEFQYCPLCRTPLVKAHRGGLDRLACPACDFVHWRNPVPVVGAIVERAGCVVLVHGLGRPPHWFGLVAGFLETGESPADCALREVKEELGLDATFGAFIGIYPFARLNQIIFVYHVLLPPGEIRLAADELDDYREIPLDKVKPWPQGTGPGLRDWLVSRGYNPTIADFGTPQDER